MPPANVNPTTYIESGGLLVPPSYRPADAEIARRQKQLSSRSFSNACSAGFAYGLRVDRDPDTLVIQWAEKGSGLDDLINQALADGEIANIGISPVVFAQLNGIIKRRQNQALSTSIVVTGRSTPANRASGAISRWNDSPLGAVDAFRKIVYQLDTYNRGAPVATVPLWLPTDHWEAEGLHLRPLTTTGNHNKPASYWLDVDWSRRKTAVPYLPNVFDLEPTGLPQWPYWFRKTVDNTTEWILLHESQIISLLSGWTGRPGIGTSAVYICLGFLGEHALAIDERYEAMIDAPGEGIVTVSGTTQTAKQVRGAIEGDDSSPLGEAGRGHDWTLLASPNDLKVGMYRWRQWDSVQFKDRQEHFEDILALAFDEPLSSVVIRGGVGYGTQAHDAGNNVAEGGVFAVLKALELVLGTIYTRVSVSVTKTNDRARALALDLLDKFATAMAKLPQGTLTPAETRAYIDREILTIPVTASDIVQDDARAGAAAENPSENALLPAPSPLPHPDPYGANALASEADELLASILASLSEDELQALTTETNQVAAPLRLTNHIDDLAATNALLATWLAH